MTGSEKSAVKIWDVGPSGDAEWANVADQGDALFARDGSELITSSIVDGTVTARNIESGQQRPIGSVPPYEDVPDVEHELSPDGSLVAIRHGATFDSLRLSVRDVATGDELFAIHDFVDGVDWSPSGEYLAVASRGDVSIYDRSGQEVGWLPGGAGRFGPHGVLATYGTDGPIKIWDWRRGVVIATLPAAAELVAFDPTGERIVTEDLQIWDVASEKISLRLPVSPPSSVTFAFSPDGSRLAVATANEVKVFDAVSGAERQVLRDEGVVEFAKVAFSPDGSMLASSSSDGTRVWALGIDDLLAIARQKVTRSLSVEECRRYLRVAGCPDP
jgi:WD40 repeat protein